MSASLSATADACTAIWTGLDSDADGIPAYPQETLRIDLKKGTGGELQLQATVSSPQGGVFSAIVPVVSIKDNHRVYLPYFGGAVFDKAIDPAQPDPSWLRSFQSAPFWEAPVVAVEGPAGAGSLGLWIADPTLQPNSFFLSYNGSSFAVGFQQLAILPYGDSADVTFSGAWWLDETLHWQDWAAMGLMVAAIASVLWPRRS